MDLIESIILGFVQGATEFLPISSSGHLVIFSDLLGVKDAFEMSVMLNIGTLGALIYYSRRQLLVLWKQTVGHDYELVKKVLVGVLPAALAGLLFRDFFEGLNDQLWVVAMMLVLIALPMLLVKAGKRQQPSYSEVLLIGCAQALALVPGTSRSGATILAALAIGLTAKKAVEWSFLLAIPTVAGAIVLTMLSSDGVRQLSDNFWQVAVGNLASFIVGLLAIEVLIGLLSRSSLRIFAYYRISLAIILVILVI